MIESKELIILKTIGKNKRVTVRIVSFVMVLFAVLSVWGIVQTYKAIKYAKELTVAHQRTVASLASYIDSLENDLRKMQYANTQTMTSGLSVSLCKASAGAKNCLSELNAGETPLSNVNKFLSQASDYIQSINKKVASGEKLSETDHEQITRLYNYAASLSDKIGYMEEVMLSGDITFEDAVSTLSMLKDTGDLSVSYSSTVTDAEKSFADYPTLIYDGPFSDNLMKKESELLKYEEEITQNEAKKRASAYSGIPETRLIATDDEKGTIEAYVFYYENTTVAVTKKGGYLLYLLSDTFSGETEFKENDAVETAKNYLTKFGYGPMKESYYFDSDGICTINFAYTSDDIICYPDLIKVSVSLDKNKVVAVDCSGYLMNHKKRDVPENTISVTSAEKAVSPVLSIKSYKTAFIPMNDGNEIFTYEFLCNDKDGNDVLVYINAVTGDEADIKLLLYSDNGTLTR